MGEGVRRKGERGGGKKKESKGDNFDATAEKRKRVERKEVAT